jgi:replication initiation and membrane attachment protein DnaB
LRKKYIEKIKTHIAYSRTFSENRATYEAMWENKIQADRPQMAI